MLHAVLRIYPKAWRDRYGDETSVLIDDLLAGEHPRRARLAFDLLIGGLRERVRPTTPSPRSLNIGSGYVRLYRHRDLLFRTSLDAPALAIFGPGEEVVGTFNARTSRPAARHLGLTWLGMALGSCMVLAFTFARDGYVTALDRSMFVIDVLPVGGSALALLAFSRATGARTLMFALTTRGLVECRTDKLGRPRAVASRSPAVAPRLLHSGRAFRQVELDGRTVWVSKSLDPFMTWMSGAAPQRPVPA